ncbi:MAG: 4-hydroxy-3-methylbut-2-enyl diphosphate reductase [Thermoguttaceae bacterium]|nr:4-hydroxy-3-methylbut-2-enyl diphosphate reductase [Thermoguttaceae bacterium]
MKIILVSPRGFCAGVNRAISALHKAREQYGAPFYVFHEIVHNTWVVQDFQNRDVHFINSIEEIPDNSRIMFSAHGVSPKIRERCAAKKLKVIDATCPLVTRIHTQAVRLAEDGFRIILIGHAGHDEIVGIVEEAPEAISVICSPEEAEKLSFAPDVPIAYLTQTTLSAEAAQKIIDVLKRKFPNLRPPKTGCICFATQNRQNAIRELLPEVDAVLIVGSPNSSNSQRLRELASGRNLPAFLVDGPNDVKPEWFSSEQTLLISAGASAPECVVQTIVEKLKTLFQAEVEERNVVSESLQFRLPDI